MVTTSRSERLMWAINILILCVIAALAIIPLLSVIATSLSSRTPVESNIVTIFPIGLTLDSWKYMLARNDLWMSLAVTVATTVLGAGLSLLLNALTAYPLSKKEFSPAKVILLAVVISMIFKAPLIPYFLTVKRIGLYDNLMVLIIPHLLSEFNLVIMITFFRQFPVELEEAAVVEGCGYFRRLFWIVFPLSKPVFATLGLFYAVMIWNQFLHPLLFIANPNFYPLQIKIRQLITSENAIPLQGLLHVNYNMATLQAVAIVFAVIPILLVYPALQKYFAKGALIGSIKG